MLPEAFFSSRGSEYHAVAADCVVLPAVYVEAVREDVQRVLRQNSARALSGSYELPTIAALAGQISHDILPMLIHEGFFKLRSEPSQIYMQDQMV